MLFKASKKAPYLYRHKNSASFYFRRCIPAELRSHLGKREIKVSLQTSDKVKAMLLHDRLAFMVSVIFASPEVGMIKKLEIGSLTKNADGSIKIEGLKTDPNNPEGDLAFLKALGIGAQSSDPLIYEELMPQSPKASKGMRFSELVVEYFGKKKNITPKKKKEDKAIYLIFMELYDDPFVKDIDHPMMSNFQDMIEERYPANAKKKKNLRNLTAKEIVQLDPSELTLLDPKVKMLAPKTINKYINRLGSVFQHAVNRGYIKEDFSKGKRVDETKNARDQRETFDDAEVRIILEKVHSKKEKNPDLFWIMYVGAYSGMRISEICQLEPRDIMQDEKSGVWYLFVNDDHELKSCKTNGSKRAVPLHSMLLDEGILDFFASRKNKEFIFKWKYHPEQGWSYKSSKDTAYFIQTPCSITEKSFHCFRHTVTTILMNELSENITKEMIAGVLGHSQKGETFGRYGKGFKAEKVKPVIEAIKYDCM